MFFHKHYRNHHGEDVVACNSPKWQKNKILNTVFHRDSRSLNLAAVWIQKAAGSIPQLISCAPYVLDYEGTVLGGSMMMAETFSHKSVSACLAEYFRTDRGDTLQFGASAKMTLLCSPVSF